MSHVQWQLRPSPASPPPPQTSGVDTDVDVEAGTTTATTKIQQTADHDSCSSSSPSYHQVVTRESGFAKGDIMAVVPLLVLQQQVEQQQSTTKIEGDERSCSAKSTTNGNGNGNNCLPLQTSSSPRALLSLSLCPLSGIHDIAKDRKLANVEYRWSSSTINSIPPGVRSLLMKSSSSSSSSLEEEQEQQKEILLKVRYRKFFFLQGILRLKYAAR